MKAHWILLVTHFQNLPSNIFNAVILTFPPVLITVSKNVKNAIKSYKRKKYIKLTQISTFVKQEIFCLQKNVKKIHFMHILV
jgi:hypothetical protein